MSDFLWPVVGYCCGAVPFGVIVARAKGIDPFTSGSGNVGATNIGRLLGKPYGYFVFLCDFLKGLIPTALAIWYRGEADMIAVLTGLCAILGHMLSPFLRFRGGKGVATGAGVMSVLLPGPAGLSVLAFISTIVAGCTMSLASMVAAVVLAAAQISISGQPTSSASLFAILVSVLVVIRHRANITRLIAGTESHLASLRGPSKYMPGIHTVALGLWFGTACFFSLVIAPAVFQAMKDLVVQPPNWLALRQNDADVGSRLGGTAVAPLFPRYFLMQAICATISTGIAIGWLITHPGRVARWRAILMIAAMILMAAGWPVSRYVGELRMLRFDDEAAKAAFATWHGISLALNLSMLPLLAVAMFLAGFVNSESLPDSRSVPSPP